MHACTNSRQLTSGKAMNINLFVKIPLLYHQNQSLSLGDRFAEIKVSSGHTIIVGA